MFEDLITPERIPLIERLYHSPSKYNPVSFGFRNFLSELMTEFCLKNDDLSLEDVDILETDKSRKLHNWENYKTILDICVHHETGDFIIRFQGFNEDEDDEESFTVTFVIKTTRSVVSENIVDPITGVSNVKRTLNEKKEAVIYTEPFDWDASYLKVRTFYNDVSYCL